MPATATEPDLDDAAKWLSVQTAAAILDMPERTVRHYCATGKLPARKFGRIWRIKRGAVEPEGENA